MMRLSDAAREVKNLLSDPRMLCAKLGIDKHAQRQATGLLICCPAHGERRPSMSVTTGPDGTVRVRCFSCGWTGDAIALVGLVYDLSTRGEQFKELLIEAAALGGDHVLADALRDGREAKERKPVPAPKPRPEAPYPDAREVSDLWGGCAPVDEDRDCSRTLVQRMLDPERVARTNLARAIPDGAALPGWAKYHGRSWSETGHRMLLRVWDAEGKFRSVRAWRVVESSDPKRLPPAGKKATALVLANPLAVGMLRRRVCPRRLLVVEGEPDFLVASVAWRPRDAVIGIGSGSWTQDFAKRVPTGTKVMVATHNDTAGDRYAEHVIETLGQRCAVWRYEG